MLALPISCKWQSWKKNTFVDLRKVRIQNANETFFVQAFEEIDRAIHATRAACARRRVGVRMSKGYCCCARNASSPMTWLNAPLVNLFPFIAGSIETLSGVRFLARKTLPTIRCMLLAISVTVPFFL